MYVHASSYSSLQLLRLGEYPTCFLGRSSTKTKTSLAHGEGTAPEAPGKTEGKAPGEAPVASDSGNVNVGIDNSATNVPGEQGIGGVVLNSNGADMSKMNQGNQH
jgi:hypothetical protein